MAKLSDQSDFRSPVPSDRRRGLSRRGLGLSSIVEFWVGLADSLHRNILLGILVFVLAGAAFQLPLFEISLIFLFAYLALMAIASLFSRR
ncbi:hypothetical protein [Nioella nitratireducens]|uniref:hypothetical protein n=1 Tax=Nioella nitratireducens TaxID=1287720 RepID=UPI0008FCF08F|nr:hypothetical protein [Nioella nitratireducens]